MREKRVDNKQISWGMKNVLRNENLDEMKIFIQNFPLAIFTEGCLLIGDELVTYQEIKAGKDQEVLTGSKKKRAEALRRASAQKNREKKALLIATLQLQSRVS